MASTLTVKTNPHAIHFFRPRRSPGLRSGCVDLLSATLMSLIRPTCSQRSVVLASFRKLTTGTWIEKRTVSTTENSTWASPETQSSHHAPLFRPGTRVTVVMSICPSRLINRDSFPRPAPFYGLMDSQRGHSIHVAQFNARHGGA